ncbi:MAG: AMP-binding protein [Clostridia bacterium]|nr:AMP-binding protein [Clostridia bacterium]
MPAYQNYPTETYETLRQMYRSCAEKFGNNTLFMQKKEGAYKKYSYRRFADDVEALGTALLSKGLGGAHVLLMGDNCYRWMLSYMAVICGVGVIVPIDKSLTAEKLAGVAKTADATVIIYADKNAEAVEALGEGVTRIAFSEIPALVAEGKRLLNAGDRTYLDLPLSPTEMRALLFTSGTTGQSKGVMLSHKNICFNLAEMCRMIQITPNDTFLSVLPLHHAFECTCGVLVPMSRGCTVAFSESLRRVMHNMQEVSPTVITCMPLFMETIYNKLWANIKKQGLERRVRLSVKATNVLRPDHVRFAAKRKLFAAIHKNFGGKLRTMISGGAAASPEVIRGLRDFGINAIQSYGLTECAPLAAINRDVCSNDSAAGMATPNALLDIYDVHNDGTGEIRYKGDNVMLGYYNMPELTAEVLRDGWLYTGDLGFIDDDGFLHITGRKKNMILTATGRHVFPEELELLLTASPYVRDAVVIGMINQSGTDCNVTAIIQPDIPHMIEVYGRDYTAEQLDIELKKAISEVNASVPPHKRIHSHILRREDFPKNTSGKIRRDPIIAEYLG